MSPTDDPIERVFLPLRTPHEPTADEIRVVRRQAERSASTPLRRARPAIAVVSLVAVAVAVAVASAVDRGQPGTFVGEAGAQEVLRAAADAAEHGPPPGGWSLSRETTVDRMVVRGRACDGCPVERATVESGGVHEIWSGPGGETYTRYVRRPSVAVENSRWLRTIGALDPPPARARRSVGQHVLPGDADRSVGSLAQPGAFPDPSAVPVPRASLIRWLRHHIDVADTAMMTRATKGGPKLPRRRPNDADVNGGLADVALSHQLGGEQRAAAFAALADRPGIEVVPSPPAFASPDRISVRIGEGGSLGAVAPRIARILTFDRSTHRVVSTSIEQPLTDRARISFGRGPRFTMLPGSGVETRYEAPVTVAGPGLGPDGHRILELDDTRTVRRDGTPLGRAE